jgi:hypothetical protein
MKRFQFVKAPPSLVVQLGCKALKLLPALGACLVPFEYYKIAFAAFSEFEEKSFK